MNIIGLGTAGCRISQYLSKYDTYKTFQIDTHDQNYANFLRVEECNSHELYESNYKNFNLNLGGHTTIVLAGGGKITGLVLRFLEELNNDKVNIIYIKPRASDMSEEQKTHHRIVNQVLQELTRSGLINEFMIVDNEKIEALVSPTITDYWGPINQLIADTYHMVNVFRNTEPLLRSKNRIPITSRITTLSLVDFSNSTEEMLYDLDAPRAKNYYFALSEDFIKNNKDLLSAVRDFISKRQQDCDCSYAIYQTAYEQNYSYGYHYATLIQEQDKKLFTSEEE